MDAIICPGCQATLSPGQLKLRFVVKECCPHCDFSIREKSAMEDAEATLGGTRREHRTGFYDEMLRAAHALTEQVQVEVIEREVHLDERQWAGMTLDAIVEEFLQATDWPREHLKFTAPESRAPLQSKPSAAAYSTPDRGRAVTAVLTCGKRQATVPIAFRPLGDTRYELTIGTTSLPFDLAQMTFCPRFTPVILLALVGASLLKHAVSEAFYEA